MKLHPSVGSLLMASNTGHPGNQGSRFVAVVEEASV